MARTLDDFRSFIRTVADLDATELPNVLVDQWIREAAEKVQRHKNNWPFYQASWTVATVAGTQAYDIPTIGSIDEIESIVASNRLLEGVGYGAARRSFPPPIPSGPPVVWTRWGSDLLLFPIPSGVETLTIYGYKSPTDWVADGAGGTPDTPAEFDQVILDWATGTMFAQQEDTALAVSYWDKANLRLVELEDAYNDLPPSPIVYNSVSFGDEGLTDQLRRSLS